MTVECSGQVRATSTAAGDPCAQFGIKISPGRRRLDSDRPLASRGQTSRSARKENQISGVIEQLIQLEISIKELHEYTSVLALK